jgi:hypothetical protein
MKHAFCGVLALSLSPGIAGQAQAGLTVIDPPGSFGTLARGINNSGQITGY